jgi:phage recombination protein Bet
MSTQAIAPAPQQSKLLEVMASQQMLDAVSYKNVLLKTVFPQDKQVSMEQLASFCAVAHQYQLNPLTKEIYAFPAKTGGIIPIVSVDGWITIVQRHPQYDGHAFVHEWKDGRIGGELVSITCQIRRKDRQYPIENTEFMDECRRDTEPWRKWPSRMLRHKAFIQCARYAFGLSGIYDEDEAERIIAAEINVTPTAAKIQMPQRLQASSAPVVMQSAPAEVVEISAVVEPEPEPEETVEGEKDGERRVFPGLTDMFVDKTTEEPPLEPAPKGEPVIGRGRAQRIYTILNKHRKHTEEELQKKYLKPLNLAHLSDLPVVLHDEVVAWAEGGHE